MCACVSGNKGVLLSNTAVFEAYKHQAVASQTKAITTPTSELSEAAPTKELVAALQLCALGHAQAWHSSHLSNGARKLRMKTIDCQAPMFFVWHIFAIILLRV